jgi:hypothetical protein
MTKILGHRPRPITLRAIGLLAAGLALGSILLLFFSLGSMRVTSAPVSAPPRATPTPTLTPVPCTQDIECSDGVFCNGVERCIHGLAGADARGCHPATERNCEPWQFCSEARGTCTTECEGMRDADGDRHIAVRCGGDDCDDHDPNRHPGIIEVCDAQGHDEDCNPLTYGRRDLDGDGEDDARCCNRDRNGGFHCGTDPDDSNSAIRAGAMMCDGADTVVIFNPNPAYRSCPSGTRCVVQPNGTGVCIVPPANYVVPPRFVMPPRPELPALSSFGDVSSMRLEGANAPERGLDESLFVPPVATPARQPATGVASEVARCRTTLQSGKVSWGEGTNWTPENIDRLCNNTKNARDTIACFQSNVEKLGWAAAIDRCK